ncbi:hypothetical protein B0A55_12662 [Friedmanniomyces simplex]|uniref:Uncharacterized protein n=1 Tax=Friedmanniomyces simplex TaxID=329884 RepID=A0A4U0W2W1_9PEZI|nr:hypothetical protein B0A55_12662 [Friedmanniomyces simplex]
MPPPPPALAGLPAGNGLKDLHVAIEPTPPSIFDVNAAFLLSMGEPPHPELDQAIADGDDARVFAELARVRNQYSQPSVTFNTVINRAIECEQLGVLNLLVDCGIQAELPGSINMVFENGHTALTLAVLHEDLVVWLLSKGGNPNGRLFICRSAQEHGESDSLRLMARLLAFGAPVDKYQGENSPMWDKVGFQRGTALHSASIEGNLGAVRLLLAHGADPSRKQRVCSSEIAESSALDEAKNRNYTDIVSVLQEHLDK